MIFGDPQSPHYYEADGVFQCVLSIYLCSAIVTHFNFFANEQMPIFLSIIIIFPDMSNEVDVQAISTTKIIVRVFRRSILF